MSQIALEGMRFYAYHGFYEEEQVIGNNYVIDVILKTNFSAAAEEDDLYKTINYETVYLICQKEMRIKTKLLETIGARILYALKFQFDNIHEATIKITKENPMPGVKLDSSSVQLHQKLIAKCARCGSPLICYKDETCWCQKTKIHPQTQTMLDQKYGSCICKKCTKYYAG